MTDKPIIINGVDVSECENFSCGICEQENKIPRTINHFTADCRMYLNCYYKQLKRKEQECEELKQTLAEIKDYCNKYPQNSIGFKKYILQKISECEVKNENGTRNKRKNKYL